MFKWMTLLLRDQATEGNAGGTPLPTTTPTQTPTPEATPTPTPTPDPSKPVDGDVAPKPAEGESKPSTGSLAGGTDDTKPVEGEGEKKPDADKDVDGDVVKDVDGNPVPEAYEFKLPDGYVADEKLTEQAQGFFKENKFSPAQAQAAIDFHASYLKQQSEAWVNTVSGWVDQAKNDKDFGGKDFDANVGVVRKVVADYGDDELRRVLDDHGVGNHPAVLRSLLKIGKALGEAGAPKSSTTNAGSERIADVFYGGKA